MTVTAERNDDWLLCPYADNPSTKINALLDILRYHLGKSCTAPAEFQDNKIVGPLESDWHSVAGAPNDKILVYLAFPSNNRVVEKVSSDNSRTPALCAR